jgi:putative transposase
MADDMVGRGRLHGDIAKSLGVSVMTYHRWRKARGALPRAVPRPVTTAPRPVNNAERVDSSAEREQIRELQLENSRLRRLVTDLLLEKIKLEEGLPGPANRRTLAHN